MRQRSGGGGQQPALPPRHLYKLLTEPSCMPHNCVSDPGVREVGYKASIGSVLLPHSLPVVLAWQMGHIISCCSLSDTSLEGPAAPAPPEAAAAAVAPLDPAPLEADCRCASGLGLARLAPCSSCDAAIQTELVRQIGNRSITHPAYRNTHPNCAMLACWAMPWRRLVGDETEAASRSTYSGPPPLPCCC